MKVFYEHFHKTENSNLNHENKVVITFFFLRNFMYLCERFMTIKTYDSIKYQAGIIRSKTFKP